MIDVITIGAATQDVFLTSTDFQLIKSKSFSTGVGECFAFGAKIPIQHILFDTGGGATNAAATFAHLGYRVAALCRVGDDGAAYEVRRALAVHGVSPKLMIVDHRVHTGYSAIILSQIGERTILVHRGASAHWRANELSLNKMSSRWMYLTSLAGAMRPIEKIFDHARTKHIAVAWNPGNAELDARESIMAPLIAETEVLVMNKDEARKLAKKPKASVVELTTVLAAYGATVVIITDGREGGYARGKNALYRFWPTRDKPKNATGAGDAFGSGFVASYMRDRNIARSLAVGALNAGRVVTKMGAKNGLLGSWPSKKMIASVRVKQL